MNMNPCRKHTFLTIALTISIMVLVFAGANHWFNYIRPPSGPLPPQLVQAYPNHAGWAEVEPGIWLGWEKNGNVIIEDKWRGVAREVKHQ